MSTGYTDIPGYGSPRWKSPVANAGALPTTGNTDGDTRVTLNDKSIYVWNVGTDAWLEAATPAATSAITALNTDVSATGPGAVVATIQPGVVTNAKLATVPANTIKGNNTVSTAAPLDLTVSQVNTMLGLASFTQGSVLFSGSSGTITQDNAKFFWDDSAFKLGIGTASPATTLHIVETSSAIPRGILADQVTADAVGSRITMRKARGTPSSPAVIITGDALASWTSSGHDGTNYIESGKILSTSTGTIATGVVPSTMQLQTMTAGGVLTTGISISAAQVINLPNLTASLPVQTDSSKNLVSAVIANSGLATMAATTIKGNNTGSPAAPSDLTMAQVRAILGVAPNVLFNYYNFY